MDEYNSIPLSPPPQPEAAPEPAPRETGPVRAELRVAGPILTGSGGSCFFLAVGGVGYKLYANKDTRDKCFEAQRRLSLVGLAPAVGEVFDVKPMDGRATQRWGYTSEVVDSVGNPTRVDMQKFVGQFTQHGVRFNGTDIHEGNIGMLRGEPVWLDFSHATLVQPQPDPNPDPASSK